MKRILVEKTFIEPKNPKDSKRLKAYILRELIEERPRKLKSYRLRKLIEKIAMKQNLKQFKKRVENNEGE